MGGSLNKCIMFDTALHFVVTGPLPELLVGNQETVIIRHICCAPVALEALDQLYL